MADYLSIPPSLYEGDCIGDWIHFFFKAAVTNLLTEKNGNVNVIQLLPTYVIRRPAK